MATTKRTGFEGGLFIIPLLTLAAAIYSAVRGWRSSHSGSIVTNPDGSTAESVVNVSYFQTGGGIFSLIFLAATIGIIIWMRRDR